MSRRALPSAAPVTTVAVTTVAVTTLAVAALCATLLSGCLTPHVQPALSKAVLQARAGAGAKTAACAPGDLASSSPMDVGFGFDDATITEAGQPRLAAAAPW